MAWTPNDIAPLSLGDGFAAPASEWTEEYWGPWTQAFNEESGALPEIFANGATVLSLIGAGTAVLPIDADGAAVIAFAHDGTATTAIDADGATTLQLSHDGTATTAVAASGATTLQLAHDGTAELPIDADGATTLQLQGAGFLQTLAEILANGATTLVLQGAGSVEVSDAPEQMAPGGGSGGAGRDAFQPAYRPLRRQLAPVEAHGRAKLVLVGRGRATATPELKPGLRPPPRTAPIARPPEELREFRVLARGRQKLRLLSAGEATAAVVARGRAHLTLVGAGEIVKSWPDDTAELVAIMLMLDTDAA